MTIALIIIAAILYIEASALCGIAIHYGFKDDEELKEFEVPVGIIACVFSPIVLPIIVFLGFKAMKEENVI